MSAKKSALAQMVPGHEQMMAVTLLMISTMLMDDILSPWFILPIMMLCTAWMIRYLATYGSQKVELASDGFRFGEKTFQWADFQVVADKGGSEGETIILRKPSTWWGRSPILRSDRELKFKKSDAAFGRRLIDAFNEYKRREAVSLPPALEALDSSNEATYRVADLETVPSERLLEVAACPKQSVRVRVASIEALKKRPHDHEELETVAKDSVVGELLEAFHGETR